MHRSSSHEDQRQMLEKRMEEHMQSFGRGELVLEKREPHFLIRTNSRKQENFQSPQPHVEKQLELPQIPKQVQPFAAKPPLVANKKSKSPPQNDYFKRQIVGLASSNS